MRLLVPRLVWIGMLLGLASGRAAGQRSAGTERDTTRATLVGRKETAQVILDFSVSVPSLDTAWDVVRGPISPGLGAAAFLQTTLPIHFGETMLPAGRFQLWTELVHDTTMLIATRAKGRPDATFAPTDEVARTALTVRRLEHAANGLYLQIKLDRQGMDTVGMVDHSDKQMTRVSIETSPSTTATLLISLGSTLMSVVISAR